MAYCGSLRVADAFNESVRARSSRESRRSNESAMVLKRFRVNSIPTQGNDHVVLIRDYDEAAFDYLGIESKTCTEQPSKHLHTHCSLTLKADRLTARAAIRFIRANLSSASLSKESRSTPQRRGVATEDCLRGGVHPN